MIPSNEFSSDMESMPSGDTMYHNYLLHYDLKKCKCGKEWWQKKTIPLTTDLCVECRRLELNLNNL